MTESYAAMQPYVTVAIAFDRHSGPLVRWSHAFAKRLGRKLCLLHVVAPWADVIGSTVFSTPEAFRSLGADVDNAAHERARARLAELASEFAPGAEVKLAVVRGAVVATLAQEAESIGTCLLVVGAGSRHGNPLVSGFGIAFALLDQAPVPVMAADGEGDLPHVDEGLRILLADDLTDQSEAAVAYSASLANGLGRGWLHHIHALGMSLEDLTAALENASAAARTSIGQDFAASVYRSVRDEKQRLLEARFADTAAHVEAGGGKYTSEIVAGAVRPELADVVSAMSPDVLVFGRHHAVHKRPFFLGRMPYRSMMSYGKAVIVVPPA